MSSGKLIYIDRFFFLPYRILRFWMGTIPSKVPPQQGPVVAIKFMGMGSITRFASLCDVRCVDKEKIILITFKSRQEICRLLGFTHTRFIRTSGPGVFISDCLKTILNVWRVKPSYIVNYERCSYAVGFFSFILALRTRANIICFENNSADYQHGRVKAYSIHQTGLVGIFNAGIDLMPMTSPNLKEQVIEIEGNKVLVNCNASDYFLARRYPSTAYIELIEMIQRSFSELEFYFTGSKEEAGYIGQITSKLSSKGIRATNIAGQWTLQKFSEELASSRLFITGDSGPLHLAANLGVATLALWGPTQSEQFGYENFPNLVNYSLHKSCSPCLLHPYSKPAQFCDQKIHCLKDMSVEILFNKVKALLARECSTRNIKAFPGMIQGQVKVLQLQAS